MKYLASIPQNPVAPSAPTITVPLDFLVISGVAVALAGAVGIIKVFLGRELGNLDRKFQQLEANQKEMIAKIDHTEKNLLQIETKIASNYVSSDDWIRTSAATDAKLDALHRRLDQVVMILVKGGDNA